MTRTSRVPAAVFALAVVMASCGGRADALREDDGSPGAVSSPAGRISPQADRPLQHSSLPLPEPDAWIPRAPDRLTKALDATTRSRRAARVRWLPALAFSVSPLPRLTITGPTTCSAVCPLSTSDWNE